MLCIKVVNYVKNSALNTRQFKILCEDFGSDHKTLLFHTEVRWLSKGNMLGRLFELRDEVITFLALQKQNELSAEFKKPSNQVILAYLSDFFDTLNNLNLKLQGADSNIVTHRDAIKMYVEKLQLWIRKVSMNPSNYSSFSKVVSVSEEACFEDVFEGPLLKNLIIDHLKNLKEEFSRYFPNLSEEFYKLSTDPFNMDIQLLPEELKEEGIEIKNDSAARYDFEKMDKPSFWLKYLTVYPSVSEKAVRMYLPFSSTYMCEKAFSTLVAIKTKYRNKLDVESDLRCALSETQPRICQLIQEMQAHPSH